MPMRHFWGNPFRRALWIITMGWTALMGYLLLRLGDPDPTWRFFQHEDKFFHLVAFAVWSGLVFFLQLDLDKNQRKSIILTVIGGSLIALLTEYIQQFVPYRSADLVDFLADFFGIVIGIILISIIKKELFRLENKFNK